MRIQTEGEVRAMQAKSRRQRRGCGHRARTCQIPKERRPWGEQGGSLRLQQSTMPACSSELDICLLLLLCHFPIKLLQLGEKLPYINTIIGNH